MSTPPLPIVAVSPPAEPAASRLASAGLDYEKFLDCVHCGLCTSYCPTYLETGDENNSPRGRIYLMRAVVDGRLELSPAVNRHLDLCLDCRSCETACPSGVQYGRLIEPFRAAQRQQQRTQGHPTNADWFHRYLLYGLFPYAHRMRWALAPAKLLQWLGLDRLAQRWGLLNWLPQRLQRMQRLLPPLQPGGPPLPELLPAIGPRRARVALFTGCVADAVFRHVHWATARVLQHNGCDVVVPRSQVCCGAIHYHSGADAPALELAQTNARAFADPTLDAVIVNVAGCGSMLKDYGHIAREMAPGNAALQNELTKVAGKMRDVSEFLMQLGPIAPAGAIPLRVAYHDACHLLHAQRVRQQPRDLLALIPQLTVLAIAEPEICCGAAGSYNLVEAEMSDRLAQRKVHNILATAPHAVLTANAGCSMQLQATLAQAGQPLPVWHPMELLDHSYRGLSMNCDARP